MSQYCSACQCIILKSDIKCYHCGLPVPKPIEEPKTDTKGRYAYSDCVISASALYEKE